MRIAIVFFVGFVFTYPEMQAQYWQQHVDYTMDVSLDIETHRYEGTQTLIYSNNSPDTITHVYYHLYFNAFQPGSAMDLHEWDMLDPDSRVQEIRKYKPEEEGFLRINKLTQDGKTPAFVENGTILEVSLATPILPGQSTRLGMEFSGQVPLLTRRSGRMNTEGIEYSMGQWYPKICAYDVDGWHPDPYISREFYGDFGNFDVTIRIDSRYTVAATGVLQNPEEAGHGYQQGGLMVKSEEPTTNWHFVANNVHDFVWAADPAYQHTKLQRADGVTLHFFFRETNLNASAWAELPEIMDYAMTFINKKFGQYPYPVYSFIQGGDLGMEYPMATLMAGNRKVHDLLGTAVHELIHSWYHGVLATNESLYPWMDEGFTEYAEAITTQELAMEGYAIYQLLDDQPGAFHGYYQVIGYGIEEPLSTHADHYITNTGYVYSAYFKGAVFLYQLAHIIGEDAIDRTMRRYFETWKFKHPRPLDFVRIAEKESGMVLDWYYEYWIHTTKTIDYAIIGATPEKRQTKVTLRRQGRMPMPVEVEVKLTDGEIRNYYIPLDLMRGENPEAKEKNWHILADWKWAAREYSFIVPDKVSRIEEITIDPRRGLADVKVENNLLRPSGE